MDAIVSLKSMGKVFHTKNGDVKALDIWMSVEARYSE